MINASATALWEMEHGIIIEQKHKDAVVTALQQKKCEAKHHQPCNIRLRTHSSWFADIPRVTGTLLWAIPTTSGVMGPRREADCRCRTGCARGLFPGSIARGALKKAYMPW